MWTASSTGRRLSSTPTAARKCEHTRSGLIFIHDPFSQYNDTFQDNKLTGPASLFSASGERIEFEYVDGVVHGAAKIKVGTNIQNIDCTLVILRQGGGDMEECSYVNGVKHGKACYYWKAGHKEEFLYEKVSCNIIQRKQSTRKVQARNLYINSGC